MGERPRVSTLGGFRDYPNKLRQYRGWVMFEVLSSFHKNVIISPLEIASPLVLHCSQSCSFLGWKLIPGPAEEVVPKFF